MWGIIKKAVNSNLATPLNEQMNAKLAEITTKINTIESRVNTINSTTSTINTNTARGAIKSIQRGTADYDNFGSWSSRTISISSVNASKSMLVITSPHFTTTHAAPAGFGASTNTVTLSSGTTITQMPVFIFNGSTRHFPAFAWQVIEYH